MEAQSSAEASRPWASLGRFSVPLPAACATAVQGNPNVFVEVIVDRTPLGRAKAGAVPYAIEAGHATSADTASGAQGALETRLAELQRSTTYTNPQTGRQWSLTASFCGESAPTTGALVDGANSGWRASKSLCEATCNAPTAHMCTAGELLRFVATGGVFTSSAPYGWIAGGTDSRYYGVDLVGPERPARDCEGLSTGNDTALGFVWNPSTEHGDLEYCNVARPLYCCN